MNDNRGLIENFLEAKYAEEGLSENSIFAYSRDLKKVSVKLNKPLLRVTQSDIEKYFIYLEKLGHSKSTRARHCLLYTSPSPRDQRGSRMPSSA